MTTLRPGFFNQSIRPKLGLEQKEDYLLRPLIIAIRNLPDYNEDTSKKMHYDGYYIKPIKQQSILLEKEIKNNPNLLTQELKDKITQIANNNELLFFFSKDEFMYDVINKNYHKTTLRERIKKRNPNKKWDLKTSDFYYYRNNDGEDVEIDSIYDKIMNINENYDKSINKWRKDKENQEKRKREQERQRYTNTNSNNYRNTNTNTQNTNRITTNIDVYKFREEDVEENGSFDKEKCKSYQQYPNEVTSVDLYRQQAKIFHEANNLGCKKSSSIKMAKLNNLYDKFKEQPNFAGGKKRSIRKGRSIRKVKKSKRRNTKRRYRK